MVRYPGSFKVTPVIGLPFKPCRAGSQHWNKKGKKLLSVLERIQDFSLDIIFRVW